MTLFLNVILVYTKHPVVYGKPPLLPLLFLVYTKHPVVYGKSPECSASRRAFPNLNLNLVMMVLRLLFRRGHLVYTKHPVVYGKPPE